jgi:hypothetical protein
MLQLRDIGHGMTGREKLLREELIRGKLTVILENKYKNCS